MKKAKYKILHNVNSTYTVCKNKNVLSCYLWICVLLKFCVSFFFIPYFTIFSTRTLTSLIRENKRGCEIIFPSLIRQTYVINDCTGQRRTPTVGPLTRNLCHWSGASVNLDVTGGTTAFLLDTGATCSVLPSLDPSSLEFPPFGASSVSQFLYFTPPLYHLLDKYPFTHTCSSS